MDKQKILDYIFDVLKRTAKGELITSNEVYGNIVILQQGTTPPTDEGLREKIAEGVLNAFYPDNTLHEAKLDGTELLLLNMKCHRAADVSLALLQQVIKRDYVEGFNDAISWAGQLCLNHAYGYTRHIDCIQCVIAKRKELKEQVGGKSDEQ